MNVKVLYSTEALFRKNADPPGRQLEMSFNSINDAKAQPLPSGYTFAMIRTSDVTHVYSLALGWEFHNEEQ